jgi:hypothetical protein
MKTLVTLALAASASLCLAACSTTQQTQLDNGVTIAAATFQAAKTAVDADAQAGLIDPVTARKIDGYITAGDQALAALQAAVAAGDAKTQADQVAAVIQATAAINNAVLLAVQAHGAH